MTLKKREKNGENAWIIKEDEEAGKDKKMRKKIKKR